MASLLLERLGLWASKDAASAAMIQVKVLMQVQVQSVSFQLRAQAKNSRRVPTAPFQAM